MIAQNKFSYSVSIVSHGHKFYVERLLADFVKMKRNDLEIILTLNLAESLDVDFSILPFDLHIIENIKPKGFAANHNAAFRISRGEHFVILNPDISLLADPFTRLNEFFVTHPRSIATPLIVNSANEAEDSARRFPTPISLALRVLARLGDKSVPTEDIPAANGLLMPDWIAGMFMCMPRTLYAELGGLSERFHLYCEDMDLCARAQLAGHKIFVLQCVSAIHNAQRDSHRRWKYLFWHLRSLIKFFFSATYLRLTIRALKKRWQT